MKSLVNWVDRHTRRSIRAYAVAFGIVTICLAGHTSKVNAITPNDFDGDNKSDLVVVRKNVPYTGWTTWYLRTSKTAPPAGSGWSTWGSGYYKQWGMNSDIPVSGDYGGDGKADAATYRPSTGYWHISYSSGGSASVQWGLSGDTPLPGVFGTTDYKHDCMVYRPSTDQLFVRYSSGGTATINVPDYSGYTSWKKPVPNCWDYGSVFFVHGGTSGTRVSFLNAGTGGTCSGIENRFVAGTDYIVPGYFSSVLEVAWWGPTWGNWYEFDRLTSSWTQWGQSSDIPVSGDFDGDGWIDPAIWRPSTGTWYVNPSSGQAISGWSLVGSGPGCYRQWGASGDTPLNQAVK